MCLVNILQCQKKQENRFFLNNINNEGIIKRRILQEKGNEHTCEEQRNALSLEKNRVEENLQKCVQNNKKEIEKNKQQVDELKKKLSGCEIKKDEFEEKLKGCQQNGKHGGSGGAQAGDDSEKKELKNKIKILEERLKERGSAKEGSKGTENYLISYEIFKNYVWKIYKVYKTFYIVLIDTSAVANIKKQAAVYKVIGLKKMKEIGHVALEKWNIGVHVFLSNKHTKTFLAKVKNAATNKYIILVKDNLEEIGSGIKGPLFQLLMSFKPQLYMMRDNIKTNYFFISNRLQKNSESLLNYLYFINPEIKGIIPTKLHDQILLLIFLTIINLIILYTVFYFFFVIYRFIKVVICISLRIVWGIISWIFKTIFAIITCPIKPCMRKKENKQRKVYKSHKENGYNVSDRMQGQQSDFKKSNRDHYVKHRRGRVVR